MKTNKQSIGYVLIALLTIVAIIGLLVSPPLNQNEAYHQFCDGETYLGIPNFWNVISNLPFLVVGIMGMLKVSEMKAIKYQLSILFLGVSLIAIGSGYYHLDPNNETLVWDRLPMAIVFMALFSLLNEDYESAINGKKIFLPALVIGVFSVWYWAQFDDLRLYLIVQFLPMAAMLVILICFKSKHTMSYGYWLLFICYLLAKVLERLDCQTMHYTGFMSGHSLKHLFAAVGLFFLIFTYSRRKRKIW